MEKVIWAAFFPVAAYVVVISFPSVVIDLIDSSWAFLVALARRWRSRLVHKYGQRAFMDVSHEFRQKVRQAGYEGEINEAVLTEHRAEICRRLGNEYVNEAFGELDLEDK